MSTKFIFPRFRSTRTRSTIDHGPRVANAPAPLSVTVPLTYIIMEFSNPTRSSWKFAVPESAEPPPATDCVTPVCLIRWRVLRRNGSSCGELPFAIVVSPRKFHFTHTPFLPPQGETERRITGVAFVEVV